MLWKSALVTDLSGTVGGLTASHNKGGRYFRERVVPTNPNTPRQQTARQAFSIVQAGWTALPAATRESWNTYAPLIEASGPLGQSIQYSGQQAYVLVNMPNTHANEAAGAGQIPTAPNQGTLQATPPGTSYKTGFTASPQIDAQPSVATEQFDISFTDAAGDLWPDSDTGSMIVYCSPPVDQTIDFYRGPWRIAGLVNGDSATPPTSPATIDVPYGLTAGDINKKMFVRVVFVDPATGLPNSDQIGSTIIDT